MQRSEGQRGEGKEKRRVHAFSPARTNEIKLHDFSWHVAGAGVGARSLARPHNREYKQVFLERVSSLPLSRPSSAGHGMPIENLRQFRRCAAERNEVAAMAMRFDGYGEVARRGRVIRNRAGEGGSHRRRSLAPVGKKKRIQAMPHTRRGSIPRENAFERP